MSQSRTRCHHCSRAPGDVHRDHCPRSRAAQAHLAHWARVKGTDTVLWLSSLLVPAHGQGALPEGVPASYRKVRVMGTYRRDRHGCLGYGKDQGAAAALKKILGQLHSATQGTPMTIEVTPREDGGGVPQ